MADAAVFHSNTGLKHTGRVQKNFTTGHGVEPTQDFQDGETAKVNLSRQILLLSTIAY